MCSVTRQKWILKITSQIVKIKIHRIQIHAANDVPENITNVYVKKINFSGDL